MITRRATPADAAAMAMLLNAIIEKGGTKAHQTPFDTDRMLDHYINASDLIACTVAEVAGRVAGDRSREWAKDDDGPMPQGWAVIASFVDADFAGQGVGKILMTATVQAGRQVGVRTIDATIRADNASGLGYYGAMGFVDYDVLRDVPLGDGTRVDRIRRRRDL